MIKDKQLRKTISIIIAFLLTIFLIIQPSVSALADNAAEDITISDETFEESSTDTSADVDGTGAIESMTEEVETAEYTIITEEAEVSNTLEPAYVLDDSILFAELDLDDSDTLFEDYASETLGLTYSLYTLNNSSKLTGAAAAVYSALYSSVSAIADGEATCTEFYYPMSIAGMDGQYRASDLGLDSFYDASGNILSDDINAAIAAKWGAYDGSVIAQAILRDCPYEFYWAEHIYSYNLATRAWILGADDQGYYLEFTSQFHFKFFVGEYYAAADSLYEATINGEVKQVSITADTEKTGLASRVRDNAMEIVNAAIDMTDSEKLTYYLNQVVSLTDYNYDAASSSYDGDAVNPWQIIWVFDKDSSTKVVCEGYAKAFQYLCDLTMFDDYNIWCYSVSGTMTTPNVSGPHMWNIVQMGDGKNYLVDVTNCDKGGSSVDATLFLASAVSGNVSDGYSFTKNSSTWKYTYSEQTTKLYTEDELKIALKSDSAESDTDTEDDGNDDEDEEFAFTVSYGDKASCGSPTNIVLNATGGSGTYLYYLNSIYMKVNGEYTSVTDEYHNPSTGGGYVSTNEFPFTFMASGEYKFRFYVMDKGVSPVQILYKDVTITVSDSGYPSVETIAQNIVNQCTAAGCSTDYEKALWLHDWLINNCAYDYTYYYMGVEGALARGTGTCEAYHRAYVMLLNLMGIETMRTQSNDHVWTSVKMDGNWYQVDCTWDASTANTYGFERHLYFGADDYIMSATHTGTFTNYNETRSTSYGYSADDYTSLSDNYLIRSGEIKEYSDPYKDKIQAKLEEGSTSFTLDISSTWPDKYIDAVYHLVAYQLSNESWSVNGCQANVEVTYDAKKLTINATIDKSVPDSATVTLFNVNTVSDIFDVYVTDIHISEGISAIIIPVWSQPDQSDIKWYTAEKQSDGSYKTHVDIADHNCNFGTYNIHVYARTKQGNMSFLGAATQTFSAWTPTATIEELNNGGSYRVSIYPISGTLGRSLKQVHVAVWSNNNGQDDLKWYTARLSGDKYIADIPMSNHGYDLGDYNVHIYATYSNGDMRFQTAATFSREANAEISISGLNTVSGFYDVIISNIAVTANINSVLVPVWSASGQSDIKWYNATLQSDGSYRAHVDIANHDCNFGVYQNHIYIQTKSGSMVFAGATAVKMTKPTPILTILLNNSQSVYTVTVKHAPGTLGKSLQNITVAVWTAENGQDDLKWYTARLNGDTYTVTVPVAEHGVGSYIFHVYGSYSNGKMELITAGTDNRIK